MRRRRAPYPDPEPNSSNLPAAKYPLQLVIVLILVFIGLTVGRCSSNEQCLTERAKAYRGIVRAIRQDPGNIKMKILVLNDGTEVRYIHTYCFWCRTSVGDSFVKAAGSPHFLSYDTSGGTPDTVSMPDCDPSH